MNHHHEEIPMHSYHFHIGDYASHTAHLTDAEDLAYRRLLDCYYLREGPLPADTADCARLVRLRNDAQAVEAVLAEFFELTPDGWRSARCDAEIEAMQKRQQTAKDSANRRWSNAKAVPTQCEGNASAMPTHSEPNATNTNTNTNTNISPLTPQGGKVSKFALPDWVPADAWDGFVEMRKRIKKPLTDKAMALAVNKLEQLHRTGNNPRQVLEQSTMACWQGLFEVRGGQNAGETPYQRAMRERVSEATGGLLSARPAMEVMEVNDAITAATPRRLG